MVSGYESVREGKLMGRIVIVGYRPKSGQQEALRRLILDHVATLRSERLVTDRVPITMQAQDGTVVEVFEWASSAAIERAHTNPAVLRMWGHFSEVCDYVPIGQVAEAANLFSEFTPIDGVRYALRKSVASGPKHKERNISRRRPPTQKRSRRRIAPPKRRRG
jgi:hypothetical protein